MHQLSRTATKREQAISDYIKLGNDALNFGHSKIAGCFFVAAIKECKVARIAGFPLAQAYQHCGIFHQKHGSLDRARHYFGKAHALYKQLGATHNACLLLDNIATILIDQGRKVDALNMLHSAVKTYEELEDRNFEYCSRMWIKLAYLHDRLGQDELSANCVFIAFAVRSSASMLPRQIPTSPTESVSRDAFGL